MFFFRPVDFHIEVHVCRLSVGLNECHVRLAGYWRRPALGVMEAPQVPTVNRGRYVTGFNARGVEIFFDPLSPHIVIEVHICQLLVGLHACHVRLAGYWRCLAIRGPELPQRTLARSCRSTQGLHEL